MAFNHLKLPKLEQLRSETTPSGRYYVTPRGDRLPTVTTVLGHSSRHHIQEWRNRVGADEAERISKTAAAFGTKFHDSIEKILRNETPAIKVSNHDFRLRQALNDLEKHLNLIDNIYHIEVPLYSLRLGIAGKCDLIAEYQGVLVIIDFKTSSKPKKAK